MPPGWSNRRARRGARITAAKVGGSLAGVFVAAMGVLALALWAPAGGPAPNDRGGLRPVVVQTAEGTLEGAHGRGVPGPATFEITLPRPTRQGDFLVAGIIDGVVASGMGQPRWHPPGWLLGVDEIGGETRTDGLGPSTTGGLQAAIFYRPDTPAGLTTVELGTVPSGTQAAVTGYVAELSGVPGGVRVVASGRSTSGPTQATWTDHSSVATDHAPRRLPALALAVFTNGGTDPYGEQFTHSPDWRVLGQDADRNGIDQPILFDERVVHRAAPVTEWMTYDETIDNCAAVVVLG